MQIDNLSFFDCADKARIISGGVGTTVGSSALAFGESPFTRASASSSSRALPSGGGVSIGQGKAFARGTNPTATVETAGTGDVVFGKTKSTPEDSDRPFAFSFGFVVAIDFPNR